MVSLCSDNEVYQVSDLEFIHIRLGHELASSVCFLMHVQEFEDVEVLDKFASVRVFSAISDTGA